MPWSPFGRRDDVEEILRRLCTLEEKVMAMIEVLDDVLQATRDTRGKVQSLIVLFKGLAEKLEAAKADPVKVQAIADEVRGMGAEVDEAVNANPQA